MVHPVSQTVNPGDPVTFTVTATGTAPLSYQWKKNGGDIGGATSSAYTIGSAAQSHEGSYTCYVSNSIGDTTSNAATLNSPAVATSAPSCTAADWSRSNV